MLRLIKIYFLFNLHFILTLCVPNAVELSVQILDKKLIEKKRQDTRDMCKLFNSETVQANLVADALLVNKYDKRKKELQLKEEKEELQKKSNRTKRAVNNVNPALNVEDEERVETIVDKIYDDLLEKGQRIQYRRKGLRPDARKSEIKSGILAVNNSRRFPFAPLELTGSITTERSRKSKIDDLQPTRVRFENAIVPYFIDSKTYDSELSEVIMKAFDYIEKATCVRLQRLRERPTDQQSLQNVYWIYISNPAGLRQCVHSNERARFKGVQLIVLGYDCMSLGDITHEIMHVLGFTHEHVRPDRDQYITIHWANIKPGYRKYFEIQPQPMGEDLPYDYASVLHYPPRAFSKNGQPTITTETGIKIGQRQGFSEGDVEKIGVAYSSECIKRNREYLLKTCPSVVKSEDPGATQVSQQDIEDYFGDRLWPYGVVNYKFKNALEFSTEELENIKAVIRHLEKETCVEFRDLTELQTDAMSVEDSKEENINNGEEETVIAVTGSNENKTKVEVPDIVIEKRIGNEIVDPLKKVLRKGDNGKGIGGIKGKANVTAGKQSSVRTKSATTPTPSRRHVNHVLELSRSPKPGCRCPIPGKPDATYNLIISADCFNSVNDLLHIFVHTLGLDHQHNMHDRDSYLHIMWNQLTEDVKKEMTNKLPPSASMGFQYDYQSVMHYPWLQIKDGKTNIMYPIWNDGWAMGHWQGLSTIDVQKLNLLYFKNCMQRKQMQSN